MYKKFISLIMIALLFLAVPVMADDSNDTNNEEEIPAIVNGEKISMSELDSFANTQQILMSLYQTNQEFAQIIFQTEAGNEVIKEYRKKKLDELITKKLMVAEAKNREIKINQEKKDKIFNDYIERIKTQNNLTEEKLLEALGNQGIESLDQYKTMFLEQSEDGLLLNELQKQVLDEVTVSEDKVKNYYESNKPQFEVKEQVKTSHILFKTEERSEEEAKAEAEKIVKMLEEGKDFAELAKEYSEGPSASNGGDIGYITKDDNIALEYKEAAFSMNVDEVSEPVKSEFGYHVIKVTDKKEAGIQAFAEVKGEIESKLLNTKKQQTWEEFVRKLRDEAEIEVKL